MYAITVLLVTLRPIPAAAAMFDRVPPIASGAVSAGAWLRLSMSC